MIVRREEHLGEVLESMIQNESLPGLKRKSVRGSITFRSRILMGHEFVICKNNIAGHQNVMHDS